VQLDVVHEPTFNVAAQHRLTHHGRIGERLCVLKTPSLR
jgi:hypothetical protein